MSSAPPPYSPYGQDPRVAKYQRRMLRDQARAQRAMLRMHTRAQMQAQKRGSLLGPVMAIAIGIVFLLVETGHLPSFRVWEWYGRWWPLLLVLGGVTLIVEWAIDRSFPHPNGQIYVRRRAGGAIALILLLGLAGAAAHEVHGPQDWHNLVVDGFSINPDNVAEFFGSRHESDQTLDLPFPAHGLLTLDVPHGDIAVTGTSTDGQIHLTVHKQLYSSSDSAAEQEARDLSPQVVTTGTSVTITIPSKGGASADLSLTIPPAASLTVDANHGDVRVDDLAGPLTVIANHGDIALSSITGPVTSRINSNGASFSAHKMVGSVNLEGHADDLTLSDIDGPVSLTGDFYGDTHLEHIAGAVRFHTSRTDLQVTRIDGQIEVGSEEITADQIAGPVVLTTRNRNLRLDHVVGRISVTDRNASIDLTAVSPLQDISVQNRDGSVTLNVPDKVAFSLNASTDDGSIENDFAVDSVEQEGKTSVTGTVGHGGPSIRIDNNHGDVAVRKAGVTPPLTRTPTAGTL